MMETCSSESSTDKILSKKFLTVWLSYTILKQSSVEEIIHFRKIEKIKSRLTRLNGHRSFNETCITNKLLPTYTNIKIHRYNTPCVDK